MRLADTYVVTEQLLKPLLVRTLEEARDHEETLARLALDDLPAEADRWSAKDHVAHLDAWRRHAAEVLNAAGRGEPMSEEDASDIDAQNARVYAATHDLAAGDVVASARESYALLISAIHGCTEEQLWQRRVGRPGAIWRVVPGNGHPHVAGHLTQWFLEHGDGQAADAIAAWSSLLDDLFTDNTSRAAARYNYACYFAKAGRVDEALPLLQEAFGIDAGLRSWAAEDSDLSAVRGDPRVAALLA